MCLFQFIQKFPVIKTACDCRPIDQIKGRDHGFFLFVLIKIAQKAEIDDERCHDRQGDDGYVNARHLAVDALYFILRLQTYTPFPKWS